MNVSGQAVQRTQAFYKIEPQQTIVVHDEIDLPFGKLRVKVGGGHGGHNGLRSIIADAARRLRSGALRSGQARRAAKRGLPATCSVAFSKSEQTELPFLVGGAADAVQLVLKRARRPR